MLFYIDSYLGAVFGEHQVYLGTTHHVVQGALGGMAQGAFGVAYFQHKFFGVVDYILY